MAHTATHELDSPDGATYRPRPWSVLALLCVAQFMVILDITIVNVALPSIGAALHFAAADLQWVVTAYVICSGGLLLIGGRAGDLLGRRTVFIAGLLVFTTASLASGLALTSGVLVASRALQGVGAAMLTPSALSIVATTYEGAQRATALAVWGAIGSAGAGAGVIVGGMLTTWLSWEWVFLVNVPVGLAAAALGTRVVPAVPRIATGRPLDIPGALAVVAGLAVLVYAVSGAPDHGWGSARTIGLLGVAAGLLVAFATLERTVARPLLPPSIWKVRSLASGAALMLGTTGVLAGAFYLNSLYLQRVLGWSALETGLGFLPLVAAIGAGVHAAGHLLQRFGARIVVITGMTLIAAGAAQLALAPDHAGYLANLLPGFLVLGAGIGLVFPAVQITAMSEVDHERAGLASGLMMTAHELGAALGIAVLSAIAVAAGSG
ncbi:MAG: major facilitator superfamily 1, partial [Solirubrobacterales bacterium]|nr:major facilitator superfamily 1 [Solirubrobacterales bacterium]